MKRTKFYISFVMILMIAFMAMNKTVHASDLHMELHGNKNYIGPGEEVDITLRISGMSSMSADINVVKGKIEYDSNVIEEIQQDILTVKVKVKQKTESRNLKLLIRE